MAKTQLTLDLEKEIHDATKRLGLVFCTEVSIGKGSKERVDAMTIDSKDIVRCYEVKVSKQDFYSKAKKSFVGHYNYYVMPKELFDVVKQDIPDYVGVYCGSYDGKFYGFVKKSKKQKLKHRIDTLKTSMMFALYREADKGWKADNLDYISGLKRDINNWKGKYEDKKSDAIRMHTEVNIVKHYLRENSTSWNTIVDKYDEG